MQVPIKPKAIVQVPIYLKLTIFVDNLHLQEEVKKDLLRILSSEIFPNGTKGFFHADNLSRGQSLYRSQLINSIMEVNGVIAVEVDSFERVKKKEDQELTNDIIKLESNEVIRLDNNPAKPENGLIEFDLRKKF